MRTNQSGAFCVKCKCRGKQCGSRSDGLDECHFPRYIGLEQGGKLNVDYQLLVFCDACMPMQLQYIGFKKQPLTEESTSFFFKNKACSKQTNYHTKT